MRSEQRARTLFENGEFEQALTAVQSGLVETSINPIRKARMLRLKAKILAKLGRETEAKQAREEAARIDPLR